MLPYIDSIDLRENSSRYDLTLCHWLSFHPSKLILFLRAINRICPTIKPDQSIDNTHDPRPIIFRVAYVNLELCPQRLGENLGVGVLGDYVLPDVCWEINSGPLKEQ